MEFSQLRDHDFSCYFEVTQGLLGSIQHKEAAADIIESSHCVYRLYSKQGFSDFPRFQKAPS